MRISDWSSDVCSSDLRGIVGFTYLAVRLGIATLPSKVTFGKIVGVGFLGGIGFTMSIFISVLAFSEPEFQTEAKISILAASLISGLIGYFILKKATSPTEPSILDETELDRKSTRLSSSH